MKAKSLIFILLSSLMFVSCDWNCNYECYISNETEQEFTVTLAGPLIPELEKRDHCIKNENGQPSYIIPAGKKYRVAFDCDFCEWPSFERTKNVALEYFGDSVLFSFKDGTQQAYYKNDTSNDSPYNFDSDKYTYREDKRYLGELVFKICD